MSFKMSNKFNQQAFGQLLFDHDHLDFVEIYIQFCEEMTICNMIQTPRIWLHKVRLTVFLS